MFGKKAKELAAHLEKANRENEELKERISSLEAEIEKLKDQEASVSRAITEAGKAAARIEEEANKKRGELIAEAEETVRCAKSDADGIRAKAKEDAACTRNDADEYAKSTMQDADSYSDNTRTDVNIYVERTIMASQLEVRKRKEVMAELNELLRKTTDYLTAQNNEFIRMLESVIDENELKTTAACLKVDKCSCSCKDCENPCSVYSAEKKEEADAVEEIPDDIPEYGSAASSDASGEEGLELPAEYESPAQLMQNIYHILKRQLPEKEAAERSDPVPAFKSEEEPVQAEKHIDNAESELPHDESLMELVSDVVD